MREFLHERVENIVGKGAKCWLPAFSPFPTMFSKTSFQGPLKPGTFGKRFPDKLKKQY